MVPTRVSDSPGVLRVWLGSGVLPISPHELVRAACPSAQHWQGSQRWCWESSVAWMKSQGLGPESSLLPAKTELVLR
jgi:hypothetical protein